MRKNIIVLSILLLTPLTALSADVVLGERSPLWKSISTSRIVVATSFGLEIIGTGKGNGVMKHVSSIEGSGFLPVELRVVSGRYAFVLTDKTIDMYYINGDIPSLQSSMELSKTHPKDLSFRDSDKMMVAYRTGFETFHVNFKQLELSKIESGLVDFVGEIN